jgi:hypothetical protein
LLPPRNDEYTSPVPVVFSEKPRHRRAIQESPQNS